MNSLINAFNHDLFINVFGNEELIPQIYQELFPESGEIQSKDNFKIIKLNPGLIDPLAMEVCFINSQDNKLVFVLSNSPTHKFDMNEFKSHINLYFDQLKKEGIDASKMDLEIQLLDTPILDS